VLDEREGMAHHLRVFAPGNYFRHLYVAGKRFHYRRFTLHAQVGFG
jgi:hypothetical protein